MGRLATASCLHQKLQTALVLAIQRVRSVQVGSTSLTAIHARRSKHFTFQITHSTTRLSDPLFTSMDLLLVAGHIILSYKFLAAQITIAPYRWVRGSFRPLLMVLPDVPPLILFILSNLPITLLFRTSSVLSYMLAAEGLVSMRTIPGRNQ